MVLFINRVLLSGRLKALTLELHLWVQDIYNLPTMLYISVTYTPGRQTCSLSHHQGEFLHKFYT